MKTRRFAGKISILLLINVSTGLWAHPTPATFLQSRGFGTNGAVSLAVADFNRDGIPDIAALGISLSIFLGDGNGFSQPTPDIGLGGTRIAAADFNGDGAPDLAIAEPHNLIVLEGNGDGTFRAPQAFGGGIVSLATGDFNGDGRPDIATLTNTGQVQVFLNTGNSFQPGPLSPPVSSDLESVLVSVDLNGDGKADVAVAADDFEIVVLIGDGRGGFAAPEYYPTNQYYASATLAAADVNGDGAIDLAYLSVDSPQQDPSVHLLLNQGDGTFQPGNAVRVLRDGAALILADVNGDGVPDLLVSGAAVSQVLLGDGSGAFQSNGYYVLGYTRSLAALSVVTADFNNDGKVDVAAATGSDDIPSVYVTLGAGNAIFRTAREVLFSENPTGLATADIDGDGNLDLVISNDVASSPGVAVLHGDGTGHFGKPEEYAAEKPGALALTDVNRDGIRDIAFVASNSVGVLPGKENGTFGSAIYSLCARCEGPLLTGDFNGDAIPDLLTLEATAGYIVVVILRGRGDGTFDPPMQLNLPASQTQMPDPAISLIADLRNNGILDVLIGTESGEVFVLFGNGDGTFGSPTLLSARVLQGVGDFNQDGNIDILASGSVFLGHGDGTFTATFLLDAPVNPALLADFNGDGVPDLLTVGPVGGGYVLLGLGNGDFAKEKQPTLISGFPVAGDFNNDGKIDLASSCACDGLTEILLNTTPSASRTTSPGRN